MANCNRIHSYRNGSPIMSPDFTAKPHPAYDPHWVIIRDLGNIIEKYRARGDSETVAIYEEILARFTEH